MSELCEVMPLDSVLAVELNVFRPVLSWGSAPETSVLRAVLVASSVVWVAVLRLLARPAVSV